MASKIRNIGIFVVIATIFVLIYIFVIKPSPEQDNLVSNTSLPNVNNSGAGINTSNGSSLIDKDFLPLLLSAKNIKLDDVIFSDLAFNSLLDSPINLTPDGTEGRPNPFAQLGNDNIATPPTTPPTTPPGQ